MGKRLTLILGGARSGKSALAQKIAGERGQRVLFVATAAAGDAEMAARIAIHRASRPSHWQTLEVQSQVGDALRREGGAYEIILIDCITLLVSNALAGLPEASDTAAVDARIGAEIDDLIAAYASSQAEWILVSNEVGLGLVPATPLGRLFRDALGRVNQGLAIQADDVVFLVAGLPMRLKTGS